MKEINYVVIGTPRSGSTLLFDLLKNNGLATDSPTQLHHEAFHMRFSKKIDFSNMNLKDYIEEQFENYSFHNNNVKIRGFKILIQQLDYFLKKYNAANDKKVTMEVFFSLLPQNTKYIYISRKNKIRQTISYFKASITSEWIKLRSSETHEEKDIPYNYYEIKSQLKVFQLQEKKILRILKKRPVKYLKLAYEHLVKDFKRSINYVADYLGFKLDIINIETDLLIQRNQNNDKLYEFFKKDTLLNPSLEKNKN